MANFDQCKTIAPLTAIRSVTNTRCRSLVTSSTTWEVHDYTPNSTYAKDTTTFASKRPMRIKQHSKHVEASTNRML